MLENKLKDVLKSNVKRVSTGQSLMQEMMAGDTTTLTANVINGVQSNLGRSKTIQRGWEHSSEEEQEKTMRKIDVARHIFARMAGSPKVSRKQLIHAIMHQAHVTHSTAVSYYERIAKEYGMTNMEDRDQVYGRGAQQNAPNAAGQRGNVQSQYDGQRQMMQQSQDQDQAIPDENREIEHTNPDDPNKQGIIRTVPGAHLVYKRQEPSGLFSELWIYNIGRDLDNSMKIRREILSGTDIASGHTSSPDGVQHYEIWTCGSGQLLRIEGLPN